MKECCRTYLIGQFGDEDVINEIYGEYVSSLHAKISECEAALASGGWDLLDRAAHAMKGNALAVGDTDVSDSAIALRSAAKLQNADDAAALVAKLKKGAELL